MKASDSGLESEVEVRALDGVPLAGSFFQPKGRPRGTVLLLSGTGIPRRFYAPFAAHLAMRGLATLTLDYRGIGDSRPARWRGFTATKQDWATEDASGAFGWLEDHVGHGPRFVVGHSVGGQLLGLMERPEAIDAVPATFPIWKRPRSSPRSCGCCANDSADCRLRSWGSATMSWPARSARTCSNRRSRG